MKILTLVWRNWARDGNPVPAVNVAGEPADLTDDPLSSQADHEGRAVVALEGRAEGPNQELVRLWLGPDLEGLRWLNVHVLLLLWLRWCVRRRCHQTGLFGTRNR